MGALDTAYEEINRVTPRLSSRQMDTGGVPSRRQVEELASMLPFVGSPASAHLASEDLGQGNYLSAGANALGAATGLPLGKLAALGGLGIIKKMAPEAGGLKKAGAAAKAKSNQEAFEEINNAGRNFFKGEYIPYDAAQTQIKELPVSSFIKDHVIKPFIDEPYNIVKGTNAESLRDIPVKDIARALKEDNSFNYNVGVQGLAHGVDESGRMLHLNRIEELLTGRPSAVIAVTDQDAPNTMWRLSQDNKTLERIITEALATEQPMLQGVYRGYAGNGSTLDAIKAGKQIFAAPQKEAAERYSVKRAVAGKEPHLEMLMVDPFAGRKYGHGVAGKGKERAIVTQARELSPEDIQNVHQFYRQGGLVQMKGNK